MPPTPVGALFLAGELALDFLNTRMRVAGEIRDAFESDDDVLAWLRHAGLPAVPLAVDAAPLSLLHAARRLRETIRSLVEKRKAGRRGDPSAFNRFLQRAASHPRLVWHAPRSLAIERVRPQGTVEGLLGPIAEAAAVLLTTADFALVKRCEGEGCILWFSDQTRSHHRRWCSVAICGNRHKVAAYRKRRRRATDR
jgi:predicted RNA-binding Zn ribbon-like protein